MALTDVKAESNESGDYLRRPGVVGNSGGSAQSLHRVAQGRRRKKVELPQPQKAEAGQTDAQGSGTGLGRSRRPDSKSSAEQSLFEKDRVQSTVSTLAPAECPEEKDDFNAVLRNPYELASKPSSSASCSTSAAEQLQTPISSAGEVQERRRLYLADQNKRALTPQVWRLVWCHERCYKDSNDDQKWSLWHVSQRCGASLIRLKNAAKFSIWLTNTTCLRYVLLTGWREAKPCMSFIPKHRAPTVTIVHADCERTYRKASEWAKQLPPDFGPALVVHDLEEVNEEFLQSYMGSPDIEIFAQRQGGSSVIGDHVGMDDEKVALDLDSSDIASPEPPAVMQQQRTPIAIFMQMGSSLPSSSSFLSLFYTFLRSIATIISRIFGGSSIRATCQQGSSRR